MPLTKETVFSQAQNAELRAGHLIKGQPDGLEADTLENRTPIDNSLIGCVANGNAETVNAAVKVATDSFNSGEWSDKSPAERKKILLRWAALMEVHSEELAALDCIDAGKPIDECIHTDMPATIETFYWYAELADKCFGKVSPTDRHSLGLIVKEPIGVVGAVLPWNFPAQMFAWKVAPALAAGNAVIVKPAEQTSLSACRLVELAYEAGVPQGTLSVVCGTGEAVGAPLGLHNDVDMVSFTGSTAVGRLFLTYSARSNLKEIVLECGGKSPQIIFDDADIDAAVEHVIAGAFWNMSENCSCGSRILVHEAVKDQLLDKMVAELQADWQPGNPMKSGVNIGPMVEEKHFNKVVGFITAAKNSNAKLITGGTVSGGPGGGLGSELDKGWYVEPTLFDNVGPDDKLFQEEVFGPVIAVTSFTDEAQAIELANTGDYGLAAYVYTEGVKRAHRVAKALKAGTVAVNAFSEGDISTPFGGYKQSGFGGRDKGTEALDQYLETKTIWFAD